MTTLIRRALMLVLAWAGLFAPFQSAFAARTITSATLNGAATVTVPANASITVAINVTVDATAPTRWRSTGWRISTTAPGALTCQDHPNHDVPGAYSESFSITAPQAAGTYNVYFIAYSDDACSTNASPTLLMSNAVTVLSVTEFNSTGGSTATNGLHFYLEDTTKMQVRRLNNTGQVYNPGSVPPGASISLDNGVFIRANGLVYGPTHNVTTFTPTGGMYNTYSITQASPPNPSTVGVQQTATGNFGITAGPQVSVLWKYTTPLDFLIAEVTLTIPAGYTVSAANPVRYYHVFDTYLGGSDNGCGFSNVDATTGKRIVGTYQPASGTCTSTTALPAGINVVESFRERSGPTFSEYCASGWASFFTNGSTNCSVLQAAPMSNALTAAYVDTGMGIELDFTAPGVYTFSYDFVIGSPNVPPYDHLEIQHDGSGTLCPDTVTVLACTSSTVPCPVLNLVNTGTLTGTLTTTPAAPAITKTPATFTLGSSGTTQSVMLQAAGAGTVTLGTTGLSTTPTNGTKCWNTATSTQSCTMTFLNTPCVSGYECQETGTTYNNPPTASNRNPLYTKLSGTNFQFDVLALQSSGAVATSYTAAANVNVELFDDTTPAASCSAYASPVATQAITFLITDNGRKQTGVFNLPKAYSKLRCRVTDTNVSPTVYGCSSDDFAVRPRQFTVSSSANADALGASTTLTPVVKASAAFSLTADTATVGYGGTPTLAPANRSAHAGAVLAGMVAGNFGAALPATGNGATGAGFTYSEVGYFRLEVDGVVDSTFTAIDSGATGDCVAASSSNTLAGGKYGCNIGNIQSSYFGRFIPDHFDTTVLQGCSPFTYSAQPFLVTVNAMNADTPTAAITQNYDASGAAVFSKTLTLDPVNAVGGVLIPGTTGTLASTVVNAGAFRAGVGGNALVGTVNVTNGGTGVLGVGTAFSSQLTVGSVVCVGANCSTVGAIGSNTALTLASAYTGPTAAGQTLQTWRTYTFANRQTAPTNVYIRAKEAAGGDGVTSLRASSAEGGGSVRSGRIRLSNAHGSELLATGLPIANALEFYDTVTAPGWRTGTDTCTNITAANFAFTIAPACTVAVASCTTALTVTATSVPPPPPFMPWTLNLSKPTVRGSMCATLNLDGAAASPRCTATGTPGATAASVNAPWLRYPWKNLVTDTDPTSNIYFGTFKSPLIYRRENY